MREQYNQVLRHDKIKYKKSQSVTTTKKEKKKRGNCPMRRQAAECKSRGMTKESGA